jgi:hypothetical protein
MNMRLAHGSVRGRSFFPAPAPAHRHVRYVPQRAGRGTRAPQPRTRAVAERLAVFASCFMLAVIAALIAVAAVISPRPAPTSSLQEPWRSGTARPLLTHQQSQVGAAVPLPVPDHLAGVTG